ncbi:MAG: hypothetical protein ACRD4C_02665 [Candidatus Acidiferrales bacterium]
MLNRGAAGASIGSLYQFFPNKEAVAKSAPRRILRRGEAIWSALARDAKNSSIYDIINHIVIFQIEFVKSHRAFLPLLGNWTESIGGCSSESCDVLDQTAHCASVNSGFDLGFSCRYPVEERIPTSGWSRFI